MLEKRKQIFFFLFWAEILFQFCRQQGHAKTHPRAEKHSCYLRSNKGFAWSNQQRPYWLSLTSHCYSYSRIIIQETAAKHNLCWLSPSPALQKWTCELVNSDHSLCGKVPRIAENIFFVVAVVEFSKIKLSTMFTSDHHHYLIWITQFFITISFDLRFGWMQCTKIFRTPFFSRIEMQTNGRKHQPEGRYNQYHLDDKSGKKRQEQKSSWLVFTSWLHPVKWLGAGLRWNITSFSAETFTRNLGREASRWNGSACNQSMVSLREEGAETPRR